jgi:hypothetical protein
MSAKLFLRIELSLGTHGVIMLYSISASKLIMVFIPAVQLVSALATDHNSKKKDMNRAKFIAIDLVKVF